MYINTILDLFLRLIFPQGLLAPGVAEGRIYTTTAIYPFLITGMSWSQSEARLILVETSPSYLTLRQAFCFVLW